MTTTTQFKINVTYNLWCSLHRFNYETMRKYENKIKINKNIQDLLSKHIKTYRSRYAKTYTLGEDEINDQFISDDYELVKIKNETHTFNYSHINGTVGILKVGLELLVQAPTDHEFTLENIEGLIFNSFNSTYSFNGEVPLANYDENNYYIPLDDDNDNDLYIYITLMLHVLETPVDIKYSIA
jgi:hypothetical protein